MGDYGPYFTYGATEAPCPGLHTVLSPLRAAAPLSVEQEGPTAGVERCPRRAALLGMQTGMGAQEAGFLNSSPTPGHLLGSTCLPPDPSAPAPTCGHAGSPTGKLTDDVAEFVHSWQEQAPNQPPGPTTSSLPRPPCLQQSLGAMQVGTPALTSHPSAWLKLVPHLPLEKSLAAGAQVAGARGPCPLLPVPWA